MNKLSLMVIVGVASALLVDLQAFIRYREQDKEAKFDWLLAGVRSLTGLLVGIVGYGASLGIGD